MMRRVQPFSLAVLFDPWPLETLYLRRERDLPAAKIVCIDNLWVRERDRQRRVDQAMYQVFQSYGMRAEGVTLPAWRRHARRIYVPRSRPPGQTRAGVSRL